MTRLRVLAFLASCWLAASPVSGQTTREEILLKAREEKATRLEPHKPGKLEKWLVKLENGRLLEKLLGGGSSAGIYPFLGSIEAGGGIALGVGYKNQRLFNNQATFGVHTAASLKKYWTIEGRLDFPRLADGRAFAGLHGALSEFPQRDFFGNGRDALRSNRSNYALKKTMFGADGGVRLTPTFSIGGGLELLAPTIGRGTSSLSPTVQARFNDRVAPGLAAQPDFLHYQLFLDLNRRTPVGNPRKGGWYRLTYHGFDDRDLSRYSFKRADLDLQQYIPFLNQRRVIALRSLVSVSTPDPGNRVPFYLQETLGGSHTLRGFRNYRFTDRNLLLLQAEYRWEIFPALDGALFYDTGKVEHHTGDLNLKDLEKDYGIGFRFGTIKGVFLRVEAAFGSRDGKHFGINFSHVF